MSFVCAHILSICTRISFVCQSYALVFHPYVTRSNRMSSACHSYVLVCHPYVTRMYSYVIRMSLVCTCMSFVCHSYILLCHPYFIICGFTMKLSGSLRLSFWVTVCFSVAAPWVDGIGEIRLFLIYDQMIFQQVKFRFGLAVNLGIALRENLQN